MFALVQIYKYRQNLGGILFVIRQYCKITGHANDNNHVELQDIELGDNPGPSEENGQSQTVVSHPQQDPHASPDYTALGVQLDQCEHNEDSEISTNQEDEVSVNTPLFGSDANLSTIASARDRTSPGRDAKEPYPVQQGASP